MRPIYSAAVVLLSAGIAGASAGNVPESGPAADGSPAWFTDHAPDIHVHNYAAMCVSDTAKFCPNKTGGALRICLSSNKARVGQSCQTALAMPWQEGGRYVSHTSLRTLRRMRSQSRS